MIFLTIFLSQTIGQALAAPIPVVRVMVEREHKGIELEGFDVLISKPITAEKLFFSNAKSRLVFNCGLSGKIELKSLQKNGPKIKLASPIQISSLGGFLKLGQSQYRDDLYMYAFNRDCVVINHVDLEKYVAGLLNSEMSAKWNLETLKAQAIAARTYALYQMRAGSDVQYSGLKPPFDLNSSVKDQVYAGAHQERYRAIQAVEQTKGMVLTFEGKPIKAFYHSTCGGRTETPDRVWGARYPYMVSVECGNCEKSPRYQWVYNISWGDVTAKLREKKLLKGDSLLGLRVLSRNRAGRATRVEIQGDQGLLTIGGTALRDLLGNQNLMSTNFSVAKGNGRLCFIGHGSGHAVGMCQWGAKAMGDRGYHSNEILKRYYPLAKLVRMF